MRLMAVAATIFIAGCTLRIDENYPKIGAPYQTFFLLHTYRIKQ